MTIETKLDVAREAQRRAARKPTEDNKKTARETQRAYDKAVERQRAEEERRRRIKNRKWATDRWLSEIRSIEKAGLKYEGPVGLCSTKHAKWVGMAASVAGGAVWVCLEHDFGRGLLCAGRVAVQRPLDAEKVFIGLLSEARRLVSINPVLLEDYLIQVVGALDLLATRA